MLNLTTIQGLFYYINTFKGDEIKFDMLQGLKTELKKYKYRNKNNLYVIFEEGEQIHITSHNILTHKFNELIQSYNNCIYIDNMGIHIKKGCNIDTFIVLNYNDTLNKLFKDLDIKEKKYNYSLIKNEILKNINKNINKWYSLEDANTIYNEYLKFNIKLNVYFSKCKSYVYFKSYNNLNSIDIKDIYFNKDIYNINNFPCIALVDNEGKQSFVLNDIISNDKEIIKDKFNKFKLKVIEDGKKWGIDNNNLSYIIL